MVAGGWGLWLSLKEETEKLPLKVKLSIKKLKAHAILFLLINNIKMSPLAILNVHRAFVDSKSQ